MWDLAILQADTVEPSSVVLAEVQSVLGEFSDVFAVPTALPPVRPMQLHSNQRQFLLIQDHIDTLLLIRMRLKNKLGKCWKQELLHLACLLMHLLSF